MLLANTFALAHIIGSQFVGLVPLDTEVSSFAIWPVVVLWVVLGAVGIGRVVRNR